jgi:hypothetical protein
VVDSRIILAVATGSARLGVPLRVGFDFFCGHAFEDAMP